MNRIIIPHPVDPVILSEIALAWGGTNPRRRSLIELSSAPSDRSPTLKKIRGTGLLCCVVHTVAKCAFAD